MQRDWASLEGSMRGESGADELLRVFVRSHRVNDSHHGFRFRVHTSHYQLSLRTINTALDAGNFVQQQGCSGGSEHGVFAAGSDNRQTDREFTLRISPVQMRLDGWSHLDEERLLGPGPCCQIKPAEQSRMSSARGNFTWGRPARSRLDRRSGMIGADSIGRAAASGVDLWHKLVPVCVDG